MNGDYFKNVVLPSVDMPYKPTYSIAEAMKIFDCKRDAFYRKVGLGMITVTKDKRIYVKEFENYFSHCEDTDCRDRLKFTKN